MPESLVLESEQITMNQLADIMLPNVYLTTRTPSPTAVVPSLTPNEQEALEILTERLFGQRIA